jgi:hypothetical protein
VDTGFIMDAMDEVPDLVFSQPMSTAPRVADAILDAMVGGPTERVVPRSAAFTTTLIYLWPALRRWVSPWLERSGRAHKQRFASQRTIKP